MIYSFFSLQYVKYEKHASVLQNITDNSYTFMFML
jgi:hypothetical protein